MQSYVRSSMPLALCASLLIACGGPETATDAGPPEGGHDAGPPAPVCGNGLLESGEQCDDGNTTDGDGCEGYCGTCGDAIVQGTETCDPGAREPGAEPLMNCHADCRRSSELLWSVLTDARFSGGLGLVVYPDGTTTAVGAASTLSGVTTLTLLEIDASGNAGTPSERIIPDIDVDLEIHDALALPDGRLLLVGVENRSDPTPWMGLAERAPLAVTELPVPQLDPSLPTTGTLDYVRQLPDGEIAVIGRLGPVGPSATENVAQVRIRALDPLSADVVTSDVFQRGLLGHPAAFEDGRVVAPLGESDGSRSWLAVFGPTGAALPSHDLGLSRPDVRAAVVTADQRLFLGGQQVLISRDDEWWLQEYDLATSSPIGTPLIDMRSPLGSTILHMEPDRWGGIVITGFEEESDEGHGFAGRIGSDGTLAWQRPAMHSVPLSMSTAPVTGHIVAAFRRRLFADDPLYEIAAWRP